MKENEPIIFMIHTMIENSAPRPQLYQQVRSWNTRLCSSPLVSLAPPLCRSSTPSLPHPVSVSFQHIPLVFLVVVVVVFLLKVELVLAWLEAAGANVPFISNGFIHHAGFHVLAQTPVCDWRPVWFTKAFDLQSKSIWWVLWALKASSHHRR